MKIVFDLDNTLVDEFGQKCRPNIIKLLTRLKKENFTLYLWTNSTKQRAKFILREHKLDIYFDKFIFREDYDKKNQGIRKDIRKINADMLIDDDPDEISYMKSIGKKGILIKSFKSNSIILNSEFDNLYRKIIKSRNFFSKFFKL